MMSFEVKGRSSLDSCFDWCPQDHRVTSIDVSIVIARLVVNYYELVMILLPSQVSTSQTWP